MNKTIDQLPEKSAVAVNDEFIVFDPNDGVTKKVKGSNMQVPFQYSTTEQFTGRYWIDGKPIYSIAYSGNLSSGTVLASNVDKQLNCGGYFLDTSDWQETIPISEIFTMVKQNQLEIYVSGGATKNGQIWANFAINS